MGVPESLHSCVDFFIAPRQPGSSTCGNRIPNGRGVSTVATGSLQSDQQRGINRWWRVVGGLSMTLALGTLYAWSVFVAPLEKQFGWKRADTSMVFTIAVMVFALSFVVAGRIQDKFGPLYCSLAGGILVSFGFYLCSYTTSLTYLFVCFGVIGGLGNGFGYATPIPVMAKWFPDKRGLAVGLAVGGYGAGPAIFGPLSQLKLIPPYGLPATFQILRATFLPITLVGRINVLRTMIAICIVAMPALYAAGSNVALLYLAVFVVYWCYGTQLSVNGVATSDFWGTKNAGINYGMLFTAWGVAGIIGPRIGGTLFDKYHNYQAAFYTAALLAALALIF